MSTIDTAIILAAGRGSRLKERTLEKPKPMTKINNIPIIDNLIEELINQKIKNIIIVIGYMAEKFKKHLKRFEDRTNLIFITNPDFDKTNNIYSLWLAKKHLRQGFFLFEADIFCEENLINELVSSRHHNIIVVDKFTKEMDGTVVELTEDNIVKEMYLKRHQGKGFSYYQKYKTVNFYKFGSYYVQNHLIPKMKEHIKRQDVNVYYEQIIKEDIDEGYQFYALQTGSNLWWEIDTPGDLKKTKEIFEISE
ncbi:MAG: phosphocholine cytidylyltransferase family protein [Candidatus Cloacimonetes bacterium]|nr:phosphocholine cytidylyltransferase family protein [Candidatus Cloacimonadota bacterium]MBS3766812.1 phosphocholine cytidylyltransferase family protein [Candidatus Cloacimonadota bacterium]